MLRTCLLPSPPTPTRKTNGRVWTISAWGKKTLVWFPEVFCLHITVKCGQFITWPGGKVATSINIALKYTTYWSLFRSHSHSQFGQNEAYNAKRWWKITPNIKDQQRFKVKFPIIKPICLSRISRFVYQINRLSSFLSIRPSLKEGLYMSAGLWLW